MSITTFQDIDYSLRPAKSIERKMILFLLMTLNKYMNIDEYHYIGFGSIYYVDFNLFHKILNIKKMTSMEWKENELRARFNLPLQCITLKPGSSTDTLPELLDTPTKNITWLDYDDHLNTSILSDIESYTLYTAPESLLMISMNVHSDNVGNIHPDEYQKFRYSKLYSRVGEDNVPFDLKNLKLNKWELSVVYKQIILNKIQTILRKKNSMVKEEERISVRQIIYFHYADNAKMMTLGVLFYKNSNLEKLNNTMLENLEFYRNENNAYEIIVPKLTTLELSELNKKLPKLEGTSIEIPGVPEDDILIYEHIYRYFPNYKELLYI